MDKNRDDINRAIWELGDYFSRLGGVARPSNMVESEIYLYVFCKLIETNDASFKSKEYLSQIFLEAAKPKIQRTNSFIEKVSLSLEELIPFVLSIYEYADNKINDTDKTMRWELFGVY